MHTTSQSLSTPSSDLELKDGEVHVWLCRLDLSDEEFDHCVSALSSDELARARRFHFERDRKRFMVRRAVLRSILGRYLGVEAGDVRFRYERNGKPEVGGDIRFNVSHSDGVALFAFARGRETGIDIERIRDIPEMELIAERFFSTGEKTLFHSLPQPGRVELFYRRWTRREAFVKALGEGLSRPPDKFDAAFAASEPESEIRVGGGQGDGGHWSVRTLRSAAGYAAALAVQGGALTLRQFEWDPSAARATGLQAT